MDFISVIKSATITESNLETSLPSKFLVMGNMYNFDVLVIKETTEIDKISEKTLYPIDTKDRADVFCDFGHNDLILFPNICGLSVRTSNHKKPSNSIGFLSYEQNPVRGNGESIYIQVGVGHRNRGVYINQNNILECLAVFSAKKLIEGNWVNWYDEYTKPNDSKTEWGSFKSDSLIYSLFNSKSYQSSLRQIDYKDQLWDIKNEFFWMSVDKMKELADQNGYDELYNDARTSPDRYVHKLLFGEERIYDKLSPDAKLVLDKATELVEKSMELRQVMANEENHLNSWDAGYAQLKLVWKEYFQEDFKEFRQLYKNLENRMRPLVYELGFLKK